MSTPTADAALRLAGQVRGILDDLDAGRITTLAEALRLLRQAYETTIENADREMPTFDEVLDTLHTLGGDAS